MWHNLIKVFERTLVLNTHHKFLKNIALKTPFNYDKMQQRSFAYSAMLRNTETARAESSGIKEGDSDYVVPYKIEYEKVCTIEMLVNALRKKFVISQEEVEHIMKDEVVSKTYRQKLVTLTLDTLCLAGIKKRQFIEHPWLITLNPKTLAEKIKLLRSLNGLQDLNDFAPFMRLKIPRIRKLVSSLNSESDYIECGNRVYYIAKKLNLPASTITKYLAKRLFVLEMPWEMFDKNLQHMINYNVDPMSILKDLWAFRYAPAAVEQRLKRVLQAKKDRVMPWMVRCPEPILQRSLQISLDEQNVLGEKTSVAEYIGERLGFSVEHAKAIMDKHPQVNTVRVPKIKEVLDYLLNEAQFTRYDIAQAPRILCHSLKTTKERIEELKKYGCRPSSLVIVCRSKREYEKFLKEWLKTYGRYYSTKQEEEKKEAI